MKLRPLPSPPVAYQLLKIIDGAADACDLADRIAFLDIFVMRICPSAQLNGCLGESTKTVKPDSREVYLAPTR